MNDQRSEQVLKVLGDLTVEADCEATVNETLKRFNRIDVLVANAGINLIGSLETLSLSDYDRVMNTNLRSVVHLTKLCTPHLIQSRGNIVNVSSVCSVKAVRRHLHRAVSI